MGTDPRAIWKVSRISGRSRIRDKRDSHGHEVTSREHSVGMKWEVRV